MNQSLMDSKALERVLRRCWRDLPICCDMKVHVQLLRFLYSVTYKRYDMHQMMFCVPLHYGIWHPYKY